MNIRIPFRRNKNEWPLMNWRARRERGRKGFTESDVWSFDSYIAGVIAGGLRQLSERAHGYPMSMYPEDWGWEEIQANEGDESASDQRFEQWQRILRRIADAFERYSKDDYLTLEEENEFKDGEFKEAMELFVKYFGNFWD
jgi:hypothetical protein